MEEGSSGPFQSRSTGWVSRDLPWPGLCLPSRLPCLSPGVFTAPLAGRYLLSAVLTGHRHEKVEAVLSRSNMGVARIDSGGYEPEGLENKPVAESQPSPGALGVFSLILPLQAGDTVCIDLVTGQLAHSEEPLTIFSGALLYEDLDLEQV